MFDKILIANRGEIALRVLRACKELGIATVAVHSTADADAMHVRLADESVCIGPPPAATAISTFRRSLAACEITGADAIHPGYGFLSENARFAEILEEHDITFIGPTRRAYPHDGRQDRGQAHGAGARHSGGAGLGRRRRATSTRRSAIADEIGYPVLVKAAAGGGGRGMKVARTDGRARARASDRAHRGEGRLRRRRASISRSTSPRPRHIEIQVLGDGKGNAIHLGERDCSLQRRHQKVWEEAPSPALNAERARRDRRDRRQGDAASSAIAASARSSSCTRTASSTSSR